MAEALIFGTDNTNVNPLVDAWSWKRGFTAVVKPDGWVWGALEVWPTFALFKFPGIAVARVEKYLANRYDLVTGRPNGRRIWQIQWLELPLAARQKIIAQGGLTIGPTGDYTWAQVKGYYMRLDDLTREIEDMVPV